MSLWLSFPKYKHFIYQLADNYCQDYFNEFRKTLYAFKPVLNISKIIIYIIK